MLFQMDENVINSQSFLSQFEMALNLTFDRVARCSTFTRRRSALAHELFVYSTYEARIIFIIILRHSRTMS